MYICIKKLAPICPPGTLWLEVTSSIPDPVGDDLRIVTFKQEISADFKPIGQSLKQRVPMPQMVTS